MENQYRIGSRLGRACAALLLIASATVTNAQTGIGTLRADTSAILELSSVSKGFLPPRMTSTQRLAINPPANGLVVYQTNDTPGLQQYVTDHWERIVTQSQLDVSRSAGGAIIPFASGAPVAITTLVGGLAGTRGLIGFGSSSTANATLFNNDGALDLTGAAGTLLNYAFSMPRAGTIRSLSVYFSNTATASLGTGSATLRAQLYKSTGTDNLFSPIASTAAALVPNLSGTNVALGAISKVNLSGLNIPVAVGERYLLVISATNTGLTLATVVAGYISGGVSIE